MPRARTGSLAYKRTTGFNARVWMPVKGDGGESHEERRWIPLDTHDEDLAKRKLTKIVGMLARGELVADAVKVEAKRIDTASETKIAFVEGRKTASVVMAVDEERLLDDYAMNRIGKMLITQVRTRDIQGILNHAARTLSRESLRKLRGALHRMFDGPWKAELIASDPSRLARATGLSFERSGVPRDEG